MTFNETFLCTRDKTFFPGYQPLARADRQNKRGGGVAILVRNGINFDVINPISTSKVTTNCPKKEPSREIIEGFCLGRGNVIHTTYR